MNHKPRWPLWAFSVQRLAFSVCLWLVSTHVHAQVVRLPAVEPAGHSPPGQLVSHPDSPAELLQAPGAAGAAPTSPPPQEPKLPPGVRNGFFQRVTLDSTWLVPQHGDNLEINDVRIEGIFALPCPRRDSPLVISPGFEVQTLEAPAYVDLPQRLYTGYTQFRWLSQVTPEWGLDFAVTPGAYSDFNQDSSKAFRLTAHGAAAWTWNEQTKIAFGAAYLDMPDNNVIPIGGLIWKPNEDTSFELLFPHPKISRRVYWGGCRSGILPLQDAAGSRVYDDEVQNWVYLAGEFSNDAWAIRQLDGTNSQVLLRDYRLILGLERKHFGSLSCRLEVGYVFGRRVRYTSDLPDYYPTDTVMVRGGLMY